MVREPINPYRSPQSSVEEEPTQSPPKRRLVVPLLLSELSLFGCLVTTPVGMLGAMKRPMPVFLATAIPVAAVVSVVLAAVGCCWGAALLIWRLPRPVAEPRCSDLVGAILVGGLVLFFWLFAFVILARP